MELNKSHFAHHQHLFVIKIDSMADKKRVQDELNPVYDSGNAIIVHNNIHLFKILVQSNSNDRIIIHQLNNPRLMLFLYLNRNILQRCIWSIWGGDVYFFKYKSNNVKDTLIEAIRKVLIPLIPRITTMVKGDYEIVQRVYGSQAKYKYSFYPLLIDFSWLNAISATGATNAGKLIMVGNSADPANHHLEIFNILAHYKDRDLEVVVPLAHGNYPHYAQQVIDYGRECFGEKFRPLTEFMDFEQYLQLLGNIDVLIMNHQRQQGLGNIIPALALGKKVYLRNDTTSYEFFKNMGITIFDTMTLKYEDIDTIFSYDNYIANNKKIIRSEFSTDHAIKLWNNVFNM